MVIWVNFCQCRVKDLNSWCSKKQGEITLSVMCVCVCMCCYAQIMYVRVCVYIYLDRER